MEGISPPSLEENPIQGEVATMENGSLKLLCLRRRSGTRRGICRSLITWITLVSDDEELDGLEKEYRNRKHSALTRQGKYERSNKA